MTGRNLPLLLTGQFIAVSGSVLIVTIGGLVGSELAPDPALATLPLSVLVLGTAAATVLAAMLMRTLGRRVGFVLGAMTAAAGACIAGYGLVVDGFVWFCAGVALYGANNAFVQQYRFAAAESVVVAAAPRAISLVLLGAIGGAFVGPLLATQSVSYTPDEPYLAGLLVLGAMQVGAALLLTRLREPVVVTDQTIDDTERPVRAVVLQPRFVVAVLGGVVGYGLMNLVMTATPLSMHVGDGHSLADTAWVIQSHVLAMYVPSLFSGVLIGRFGARPILATGTLVMAGTIVAGLQGHAVMHYWWSLVLLGVGWNFLFVGGTALLVESYRPSERFKAQAVNEFSVFGASAAASLLAGTLIHAYGWDAILEASAPVLVIMLAALAWLRRSESSARFPHL